MARYFQVSSGSIALWENCQRTIPGPVLLLIQLFEEELQSAPFPEAFLNPPLKLGVRRALLLGEPLVRARIAKPSRGHAAESDEGIDPALASQMAVARSVVKSLDEAKGLPVKIAQMMSYFDFYMPYAVKEVFATLRNQGLPINPLVVASCVKEQLGAPPSQVFAEWEATPFAAASIGQVHRAQLRSGEAVAVKVQYPGVKETIESDMGSISLLGKLAKLILRGPDAGPIIDEIREHLLIECDYELEATRQETFRQIFDDHPVIVIPNVHREFSTGKILVTSYFEGQTLEEFAATAEQASKNRIGEALWDYFNIPKYKLGLFNCDPHFGNFIVSDGKLVCLDFGCVKKVPDSYRKHMIGQALGIAEDDRTVIREAIEGMEIIKNRKLFNFEAHCHFLSIVGAPYRSNRPFRFTQEYRQALWHAMQTNPNRDHTALPKEEVMAVRCHFGEMAAYSLLQAEANWREKLLSVLQ
jgi:predicted unusual protein kinase regulating ubiquinone biosynthesis (AarF/ABC1/UbiB family)